eukprot:GHUV01012478.1.p2 GENE.GHUV01012478.1~~GHUV01012478.1.p2  ORF type:complete len:173 (+),score=31.22 GHUV01012478.1:446-964(+)
MACGYIGCGTTANKIGWAVAAVLIVIGAALIGVGVARLVPCSRSRTDCMRQTAKSPNEQEVCSERYRRCAHPHLIVAAVGAAAVVVALGVLCCMCCCSKPPGPKMPLAQGPYNMTGIQLQPGYGYPTAAPAQQQHSPYANPYQQAYNAQTPQAQQQQQFQQHQQYTTTYTIV